MTFTMTKMTMTSSQVSTTTKEKKADLMRKTFSWRTLIIIKTQNKIVLFYCFLLPLSGKICYSANVGMKINFYNSTISIFKTIHTTSNEVQKIRKNMMNESKKLQFLIDMRFNRFFFDLMWNFQIFKMFIIVFLNFSCCRVAASASKVWIEPILIKFMNFLMYFKLNNSEIVCRITSHI